MSGRWGIEGFPEPVAPSHWGGYDGLAGHAYDPAQWGPVRERLTYLAGFAASSQLGDLPGWDDGRLRQMAEACSGMLYSLTQDGGTLTSESLGLVLGAAEDAHFHDNPDEGVRFGCPTCDALLEVHHALGLPPTQWLKARLVECYQHESCPGCPLEAECDRERAERLAAAREWAREVSGHCRSGECPGCPDEGACSGDLDERDWSVETRRSREVHGYPDGWDDEVLLEYYGERQEA